MIHLQCRIKTIMPADQVGEGHTCMPLLHVRQHTHIEADTYVCKVSSSTHRNISIIASRLSAAARHTHIIIILSRASLSHTLTSCPSPRESPSAGEVLPHARTRVVWSCLVRRLA